MSLFITFEGPEGSGKSTQARKLYERLQKAGYPVILTREPGGTAIGDMVRRLLLDMQHAEMEPTTETLLFAAARAQLVGEVIRPYLEMGGVVLCDRYADSTYAYQGYGLGRDLQQLREITQFATGGLMPDLTIYLDLPAAEGLARKRRQREEAQVRAQQLPLPMPAPLVTREQSDIWNRLDARELAFHERVRQGYRELIAVEPERWFVLDARQDREKLAEEIAARIQPLVERVRLL